MAARPQLSGDGFASQISTMSKSQLYDLMCQVKVMIEQNQNQARQVLIDNPVLTRTLFQAQIMLGMVQPPKVMPNIQQVASPPEPTQATKSEPKPAAPAPAPTPTPTPMPALPPQPPSTSNPSLDLRPHPVPAHPNPLTQQLPFHQQQKPGNFVSAPPPPASVPPQFNLPPHFGMPPVPPGGNFNQPALQPPISQQPRIQVPSMQQHFSNQMMVMQNSGIGFQPGGVSGPGPQQMMPQQPPFIPSGMPSSSFPQGHPLPSQPPSQQIYQGGGSHMNVEYGLHSGMPMPSDRPGPWRPAGHPDMPSSARPQMPGLPPFMSNQIGQPMMGQAPGPQPLTNEMQKTLLDQVRSLTPDQINMLPPDQRQQVLQLQEMLR